MRVVTFFLTKTGLVLPVGEEAPQHAPWSGAEVRFRRIQGDHALGVVRPRDEVRAQTDAEGKGQVGLEPGVYEITLPAGDTYVRAIEDGTEPLDLSVVLAAGVPPTEPHYETLIEWITTNPNLKGPKGDTGEQGPPGPEGPQGPAGEGLDPSQSYTFTAQQVFEDGVKVSREGQALVVNADTVPAEIELQFAGARVGAVSADSGAVRVAADSGAADLELEGTAIQSGAPGGTDAPWVHRGTLDVSGDVVAGGRVDASADVTAVNNVSAGIDVTAGQDVLAIRDIIADRDVTAGRNVVVDEELIAFGAVRGPIIDTGGAVANVRAFGAVGDGIADDSAALTAASALGTTVVLPAGTYRIASTMSIYFPIRLENGAVLKPDGGVTVMLPPTFEGSPGCLDTSAGGEFTFSAAPKEIDPKWWGASPTATASVNAAAFQAAFDAAAACRAHVRISAGEYDFDSTLTFVGTRTSLVCDPDAKLNWKGSTTGPAIRFGDGGTTATTGLSVYDLTVVDDTTGTAGLITLDDCDRSNFYNIYATANGLKSAGSGLVLKNDSIINTFHKLKVFGPAVGVDLLSTSIANKFFDPMIESAATAGMRVPFGASAVVHNTVFGGTIENCSGPGVLIQSPTEGLAFVGTYFELNATDVKLDYAAGSSVTYNFRDCRFKSSTTGVAIDLDAIARVIVTGSNWADCTLAQLNNASARYIGDHNVSADSSTEVDNVAGGSVLTTNLSGGGILGLAGLAGLTMEGYRVPVVQKGTGVSVTAGGSQTVVFPVAFKNAPIVIPSVTAATAATPIVCDGINLSQVTFRNRGTVDATISWVAIDIGDLT